MEGLCDETLTRTSSEMAKYSKKAVEVTKRWEACWESGHGFDSRGVELRSGESSEASRNLAMSSSLL